mgnify:CR=1 FL=1
MKVISQKEAKALGLEFFFTGNPCPRGIVEKRRTSNYHCLCAPCVELRRAHAEKKYAEDPQKFRDRRTAFYERNSESERQSTRDWRARNPGYTAIANKLWRDKNPEKVIAHNAEYKARNREALKISMRNYVINNRDKVRAKVSKRRADKLQRTPCWHGELDEFVMKEAAHLAYLRNEATGIEWQIDHMIPMRAKNASGLHCAQNIQVIPRHVNISKLNRMIFTEPFEWMAKHLSIETKPQ